MLVSSAGAIDGVVGLELTEASAGSGKRLIRELNNRSANASDEDKHLVRGKADLIRQRGIAGAVTTTSLKAYVKEYTMSQRNLPMGERQQPDGEVQMIGLIAFKDPAIRQEYRLRTVPPHTPTTLAQATGVIYSILKANKRAEEIDNLGAGTAADAAALAARGQPRGAPPPSAPPSPPSDPMADMVKAAAKADRRYIPVNWRMVFA